MIRAQFIPAILLTLAFTVLTGVVFPVVMWGIAQLGLSHQANGSLIFKGETLIGSELIGQNFSQPRYFHPRPSAAGAGYDPLSSSGTNLGPTSKKLFDGIQDDPATKDVDESYPGVSALAKAFREENGLAEGELLPADSVTRSASGLDPHISPRNAQLQLNRVARERGIEPASVKNILEQNTESRFMGIFGEPRVNVLRLNMALDNMKGSK